jgi:hypothetical protein
VELDTDAGGAEGHPSPPGAAPYPVLGRQPLALELEPGLTVLSPDSMT